MHTNLADDLDELLNFLRRFAEARKWHLKYAKFNWRVHQSLLAHSINVSSLSYSILNYLEELEYVKASNKLHAQMLLTGFLHDAGKESESFQLAAKNFLDGKGPDPLDFGHQQEKDFASIISILQKEIGNGLPSTGDFKDIWTEITWSISQMGRREDAGAISQSFEKAPSHDALICKEVVHLADMMMSKRAVEDAASISLDGQLVSRLQLTYSKVSIVRGVLTQFLHTALESQFTDAGFRPIQWFPDGTVYIGRADAKAPRIDSEKLVDSMVRKMHDVLDESGPLQVAKAAYGSLTAQVIAAPEFLFVNDEIVHEFWQNISRQRFAKFNYKELDELKDTERRLYEQISDKLSWKDEHTRLTFLARFLADFNLLIVLYAARKQLVDNAKNAGVYGVKIEEEATERIQTTLAQVLEIPQERIATWPEVALQTKAEKRLPIAQALWSSPYYMNPDVWQEKFLEALERATYGLAEIWRRHIPDKYVTIARLLLSDVSHPLSPKAILVTVESLNTVIAKGKTGHGTPTCQRCGGVAVYEAQAELFGKSEIYNDNLVAGLRVGGGNKIQVCELCEFEEKLRSVFIARRQEPFTTFYIFPHLALSRKQQQDWQKTAYELEYRDRFPPLRRVNKWAELVTKGDFSSFFSLLKESGSFFSEKELAWAIQEIAEDEGLEDDLSSMLDPPLETRDGKTLASLLIRGKCKLKERFENEVNKILNQVKPIYLSPNFIMLLTSGTVTEQDEPESSAEIKWLFIRCILAWLFNATILGSNQVKEEAMLGYTNIPSNIVLRPLENRLGARKGWIPITELENSLKKLSSLILAARELLNSNAGYGNATLLRLLTEEPGRVLIRATSRKQVNPKRLLFYLDTWKDGG